MFAVFSIVITGFVLAMVDTLFPFIPPVTTTIGLLIYLNDYFVLTLVLCSIAIAAGDCVILLLIRSIGGRLLERKKDQKISKRIQLYHRYIQITIEEMGYSPILILQATAVGALVTYVFIFGGDIRWKSYFVHTLIGRALCLSLFVSIYRISNFGATMLILVILGYALVISYNIIILIIKRKHLKNAKLRFKNARSDIILN